MHRYVYKGKLFFVWGKRGTAPPILKKRSVVNFTFRLLHCSKELRYPLNMRLVGPQRRSGRFGEGINILPLSEFETRTVRPVQIFRSTFYSAKINFILQSLHEGLTSRFVTTAHEQIGHWKRMIKLQGSGRSLSSRNWVNIPEMASTDWKYYEKL